jgi:hypothetical protein
MKHLEKPTDQDHQNFKVMCTITTNMLNKKFEIESFDANCCANICLLISDESQILQQLLLQQP